CFYDHPAHNHLAKCRMKGLEVENQVQLADILEQSIKRFDKHLDEIQQSERTLGRRGYHDEVERRVVAISNERWGICMYRLRLARCLRVGWRGEERWKPGISVSENNQGMLSTHGRKLQAVGG